MRDVSQLGSLGKRGLKAALAGAVLALSAACHQQAPTGQVLAIVNGEEITVPELNAEARARGLVISNDAGTRRALLQELVDRRLLAQAARKQGLDRTPDYILQSRRAAELTLVQELSDVTARGARQPTPQQLSDFIRANPQAFGERAVVTVEQMGLGAPVPPAKMAAVTSAASLEQAAAVLGNPALATSKAMQTWDTARLDRDSATRLLAAGPNQLLVLQPPGAGWLVVRKISATPSPVPPAQQGEVALTLLRAQISQQIAADMLARARAHARISLQKDADKPRD